MSMWQMDADLKLHPRSESPKSYSSSVLEIDCKLVHAWLCLLARYAWANVSCQEVGAAPEERSGLVVVGAPNFRGDAGVVTTEVQTTDICPVGEITWCMGGSCIAAGLRHTHQRGKLFPCLREGGSSKACWKFWDAQRMSHINVSNKKNV